MNRHLLNLPDADYDSPTVKAVGLTYVQGNLTLALLESKGSTVLDVHYIDPKRESTAKEEIKRLLNELKDVCGGKV